MDITQPPTCILVCMLVNVRACLGAPGLIAPCGALVESSLAAGHSQGASNSKCKCI